MATSALLLSFASTSQSAQSTADAQAFNFETVEFPQERRAVVSEQAQVRVTHLEAEARQQQEALAALPEEVSATEAGRALEAEIEAALAVRASAAPTSALINEASQRLRRAAVRVEDQLDKYIALMSAIEGLLPGTSGAVFLVDLEQGVPLVSYNASEVFTAASTYKIFTAYSMINAVESGDTDWSSPFNGTTVGDCFDRMLTYSDNDCPIRWFRTYGHDFVDDQAKQLGARNTSLSSARGLYTTAEDLGMALRTLAVGDVISTDSLERMVTLMSEQETREGLPTAFEPAHGVVADKVGYLDEFLHDAALIFTDKGDYALVVLTENSSWETIAEVGELIYEYL